MRPLLIALHVPYVIENCCRTRFKQIGRDKNSLRADAEHRLVDLLLLGACDDLVVTCGSSYSRVAYSKVGC